VSVWYLQVTNEGGKAASAGPATAVKAAPVTLLAHRPGSQSQKPRNLKELVDPAGRRLIWVVSDCISPAWQQGMIQSECLPLWAKHGPVAIMQLLPSRLWGRTTLRSGVTVKLSGLTPGAANQSLVLHDVPIWFNHPASESQTRGLKLPIVTLEPASLALWAQMVAGFGEHQAPGVWFDEGWQEWQQDEPVSPTLPGAESLVQRFNTTASLPARQLAAFHSCPSSAWVCAPRGSASRMTRGGIGRATGYWLFAPAVPAIWFLVQPETVRHQHRPHGGADD
jgi:hypothetical protein